MEAGALISELKRRRVIRALVGYGIAAFAVLQIIEPVMHGLHWSDEVLSYVVVALAVGFPIIVCVAWIFDVNQGRIERTGPATGSLKGVRLGVVLVGIGVIAAAPGTIWYFALRGIARRPAATAASPEQAGPPSIAVLPFADMSPSGDQGYFSDGIAEEILNVLAQVAGLRVIGRTSSFSFKGKTEDLRVIGERLGVAHVLEGSVRKEGNHIRITAQLIAAADGSHIWSSSFDREMTGIFAVQDEIARAVVAALKVKLLPGKASAEERPANPEAYAQFLLGMQLWRNGVDPDVQLPIWEKAVALDPTYPAAWAMVAVVSMAMEPKGELPGAKVARQKRAVDAADRAVVLEPASADALAARGAVRQYILWDWDGAQSDLERARTAAPGSAYIVRYYAHLLTTRGRLEEALRMYRLAVELDPLFQPSWLWIASAYINHGDYSLARNAFRRAAELRTDDWFIWGTMWSYLLEGRIAEAAATAVKLTDEKYRLSATALLEHARGHLARAKLALNTLIAKFGPSDPVGTAEACAWLGERDQAFEWLDRAYEAHDNGIVNDLKVDVSLKSLRTDPRYTALLKKMNLPPD